MADTVPLSLAVPVAFAGKLSPAGSAPASDNVGVGTPAVLTVKLNGLPAIAVADAALLNDGPLVTVSVNPWLCDPPEFVAMIVNG